MALRITALAATLVITMSACGTTDPDTNIRIQGSVSAAVDVSPIVGAEVSVRKMELTSDTHIVAAWTDSEGGYSLSFVEEEFCPEWLLKIRVSKEGFRTKDYTRSGYNLGNDPTYIRCTEETQTIDFQLEREP